MLQVFYAETGGVVYAGVTTASKVVISRGVVFAPRPT